MKYIIAAYPVERLEFEVNGTTIFYGSFGSWVSKIEQAERYSSPMVANLIARQFRQQMAAWNIKVYDDRDIPPWV